MNGFQCQLRAFSLCVCVCVVFQYCLIKSGWHDKTISQKVMWCLFFINIISSYNAVHLQRQYKGVLVSDLKYTLHIWECRRKGIKILSWYKSRNLYRIICTDVNGPWWLTPAKKQKANPDSFQRSFLAWSEDN